MPSRLTPCRLDVFVALQFLSPSVADRDSSMTRKEKSSRNSILFTAVTLSDSKVSIKECGWVQVQKLGSYISISHLVAQLGTCLASMTSGSVPSKIMVCTRLIKLKTSELCSRGTSTWWKVRDRGYIERSPYFSLIFFLNSASRTI